jgi:hypothetical protein
MRNRLGSLEVARRLYMGPDMSSDKKGTKILARTFFNQLRAGGYTQNQIIDIASELIDLVTNDLRDPARAEPKKEDLRPQM